MRTRKISFFRAPLFPSTAAERSKRLAQRKWTVGFFFSFPLNGAAGKEVVVRFTVPATSAITAAHLSQHRIRVGHALFVGADMHRENAR